ncbi:vWA domain-containing protein [sulfur-oxidizing endosymbiont of Gigantopelta aegis]|uniref:vWA domain-containing protein n=1 Tax=sulfur-oxidizing endosymbiont of Gigantopelta aegis TaxID=2794934 RepID=UPI0018DDB339|nr:VWA domain-containing protein [sulfur-oxidizing endosymbiont of Gigantopelta aegis]
MTDTFHFLRPEWLWALPFIAILLMVLIRSARKNSGWENICDPELLQYQLAQQKTTSTFHALHWTIPLIFFIGIIALSGPAWEQKEQPVFQQGNALVIILDLSLSMNAKDLKPSRLERAKLKLIDILKQKTEGQTALIAFAGDAHTVSPLTIDTKTIISLLPALDSSIMPLTGTHLLDAIKTAKQLFKNAGFAQGDMLLLTDGIDPLQQSPLEKNIKKLHQQGYRFSVIGVGSEAGSPIPLSDKGGFIKSSSGQVILSKLIPEPLIKLTKIGGGHYSKLSLDDSDFQAILNHSMDENNHLAEDDKQVEQWLDNGAYLSLLLIPLALFSFRKGVLSLVFCLSIASFFNPETSYADALPEPAKDIANEKNWSEIWSTDDQRGQKEFDEQHYQAAAERFNNKDWKASAYYRAGDYEKALQQYNQSDDAISLYNKGNTLANMNKLAEALEAYKKALKQTKASQSEQNITEQATQNMEYIEKILEQQKQQSSQNGGKNNEQDSEQSSENKDQKQQSSSEDGSNSNDSNSEQSKQQSSEFESEGDDAEGQNAGSNSEEQQEQNDTENAQNSEQNEADAENQEARSPQNPPIPPEQESEQEQENAQSGTADKNDAQTEESADLEKNDPQKGEADKANDVLSQLSQEEQQSLKQWLQRIPDNPGELLRIKFRNNTLLKQRQTDTNNSQYNGNPW